MGAELRHRGFPVNKKKVQRLMRELNLKVTSFSRKSRKYRSYKRNVARNRINRRFATSIPHQKITTDTSEFKYYERDLAGQLQIKKLYLDPFLDLYNGEIVSYKITRQPHGLTILEAFEEAVAATSDCPFRRTFHSDQGWAYQMKTYGLKLKEERIFQSMSRKGNCLDNSPMENFFGLLKQEMYYGRTFQSFEELKREIERYIGYYNHERIKKKLGWKIPVTYRLENAGQAA